VTETNSYPICGKCLEELEQIKASLELSLAQPPNQDFLNLRDLFRSGMYKTYLANLERLRAVCVRELQHSESEKDVIFVNGKLEIIKILEYLPTEVDMRLKAKDAPNSKEKVNA
jgi:hypothetical protein